MACGYPKELPVVAAKTLLDVMLGREPASLQVVSCCAYQLIGYGMNVGIGEPGAVAAASLANADAPAALTTAQAVSALKSLAGEDDGNIKAAGLFDGILGGDAGEKLGKLLLPILLDWVSRWLRSSRGLADTIAEVKATAVC